MTNNTSDDLEVYRLVGEVYGILDAYMQNPYCPVEQSLRGWMDKYEDWDRRNFGQKTTAEIISMAMVKNDN